MSRRSPPKQLFHKLETDLSDTEISDLSPDGADAEKTATVERKIPSAATTTTANNSTNSTVTTITTTTTPTSIAQPKEDPFDASAVPQHELLDNSMNKSKSELGKWSFRD